MRQVKLFGVTLVALIVAAVALSASASAALPEFLPNAAQTGTGKSIGVAKLQTLAGNNVECKNATAAETLEAAKPLGLFHITFKECEVTKPIKASCKGSSGGADPAGTILSLGTYHVVHDGKTATEKPNHYAILFLLEMVDFECSALAKILVQGNVLCLIVSPETSAKSHEFNCKNNGTTGDPEETKYWNEGGTALTAITPLLTDINGGAAESSAEVATGTVEFPIAVAIMG